MSTMAGSDVFAYEALDTWQHLPEGMRLHEVPGVAVNSRDEVYVLTRNTANPVLVFDREGNFLRSFGQGIFSERTHGILCGPDDTVYCTDDGTHTVTKFTPEGELLMTIGTPNQPAPRWSGLPFCRPTQAAVSHQTGHIYISDGYANARVHKYDPSGRYLMSWGEPGIDAGQFMIPHNIGIGKDERIYVADREAHRVQVFDRNGNFLAMWNNIHRPCGLSVAPDGNVYVGELNGVPLTQDCPGYGHRVSIFSPEGTLLSRFGHAEEGSEPGRFVAPHGIAVDSHGDVYVGEVSFTIRGRHMDPPRELRSLSKLRRQA